MTSVTETETVNGCIANVYTTFVRWGTKSHLFGIKECTPTFDSPIFCETFAKIRMEKFEKLKKKHVLLEDYHVLKYTDYLAYEEPTIQDNSGIITPRKQLTHVNLIFLGYRNSLDPFLNFSHYQSCQIWLTGLPDPRFFCNN